MLRLIFDGGGTSSGTNLYAAYLYRTAAFWKEATMAKALQLLGFGNLKDIDNASIYLLSNASRWVTGSYLMVDGGILRGDFFQLLFAYWPIN